VGGQAVLENGQPLPWPLMMIDKYPYGRAPFWLLLIAVVAVVLRIATARQIEARPDLVIVTHTEAHRDNYAKVIPEFERKHNVSVRLQFTNWASLQSRLQNAILSGTDTPDLAEVFEGSLGFFTRGPMEDFGLMDLTDRLRKDGIYDRLVESRFSLWSARGRVFALPHDVHPVMLAYRRDIIESLGIDVKQLDTWEKFVEVGRKVTKDLNGDGIIDRYMLDLRYDGNWSLQIPLFQRGGGIFDPEGNVAFATEDTAELIRWYILQTRGPQKIAYEAGWGQASAKAMIDGLVLFMWAPDWRTWVFAEEVPSLKGKMALMPLPAWKPGGRRTSIWGGTGLILMKQTKHPDLAWELAKFLYFSREDQGKRFGATNILPVLRDSWDLPEFDVPSPYYSGQKIGREYAALAPETPTVYSSPVDTIGRLKLDEAYNKSAEYYSKNGESGLMEYIRKELASAAAQVTRISSREQKLAQGSP
jgi:arabinosaccharide transport system substrate-binding protein